MSQSLCIDALGWIVYKNRAALIGIAGLTTKFDNGVVALAIKLNKLKRVDFS